MSVFFVAEYLIGICVRSHVENLKFCKSDTKPVPMRSFANRKPIHFLGPGHKKRRKHIRLSNLVISDVIIIRAHLHRKVEMQNQAVVKIVPV